MTRHDILTLFEQRQAAFLRRDVGALADLYAEDGVVESLMAGTVRGRDAIGNVYRAWFAAFPDVVITSEDLIVDGLRAAHFMTHAGTDSGGFMGLPPTGKPFRIPIVHFFEFRDGRIVRERRIYDFTGLLVQIGVLKAKPA